MYSSIINPKSNQPIPLYSKQGKLLLKYYLQQYNLLTQSKSHQRGGGNFSGQEVLQRFIELNINGTLRTVMEAGTLQKEMDFLFNH